MASITEDHNVPSPQENVPSHTDTKVVPDKQLREELIATAVKFLQNPKVRQSPFAQRRAFLERKGLTKAEIDLAIYRSGTADDEHAVVTSNPPPSSAVSPTTQNTVVTGPPQVVPRSAWTKVKESTSVIVVVGAAVYAVYQFYDKYFAPVWLGKKKPSKMDQLNNSMNELRRNLAELTASFTETQQLIRSQQGLLNDMIRATSGQRGSEESGRIAVDSVKEEIRSLKALLLHKNQFPALPTTNPVIPVWQLQQPGQTDASKSTEIASSATKSETPEVQLEKDVTASQIVNDTEKGGVQSAAAVETPEANENNDNVVESDSRPQFSVS